jgi:hypothetical protein
LSDLSSEINEREALMVRLENEDVGRQVLAEVIG